MDRQWWKIQTRLIREDMKVLGKRTFERFLPSRLMQRIYIYQAQMDGRFLGRLGQRLAMERTRNRTSHLRTQPRGTSNFSHGMSSDLIIAFSLKNNFGSSITHMKRLLKRKMGGSEGYAIKYMK